MTRGLWAGAVTVAILSLLAPSPWVFLFWLAIAAVIAAAIIATGDR